MWLVNWYVYDKFFEIDIEIKIMCGGGISFDLSSN